MIFEWDENKNRSNKNKHGISFEEAQTVFLDPLHLSIMDNRFNYFEERWITIGATDNLKIVVVANMYFTDSGEEIIRIISARRATKNEQKQYQG